VIILRDSNFSIVEKLKQLEASQEAENIRSLSYLSTIREDILELVKQEGQKHDSAQAARLTSLSMKFEVLLKEQTSASYQIAVLKSLHFPEIRKRWYNIKAADQRSNEWIYERQRTSFVSWLESEAPNDAIFYITGKVRSIRQLVIVLLIFFIGWKR